MTPLILTLLSPKPDNDLISLAQRWLLAVGSQDHDVKSLGPCCLEVTLQFKEQALWQPEIKEELQHTLIKLTDQTPVDYGFHWPDKPRTPKKLFIADMDSTLITIECIDEIAALLGLKAEMAAITEATMRGELDFESSLKKRVAMLKGIHRTQLEPLLHKLPYTSGVKNLIKTLKEAGYYTAVVSGGFTLFTEQVKTELGLDAHQANTLLFDEAGYLTGEVQEPILGREAKLEALLHYCKRLGCSQEEAVAVGDGANDLAMLKAAGLGVAFRAKPVVAEQAAFQLNYCDLSVVAGLLGLNLTEA